MENAGLTTITFDEFVGLPSPTVREMLAQRAPHGVGVGIPFNGTRRWYLRTFHKRPEDVLTDDYSVRTRHRMWQTIMMLFNDGITTVYTPSIGRAMIERGPQYMAFIAQAMGMVADNPSMTWYHENKIVSTAYGELELLPPAVAESLQAMRAATLSHIPARRWLCWGVFADQPTAQIIRLVSALTAQLGRPPSENELIEHYYGGPVSPLELWIGTEQPTVFDVPLVLHGHTALYYLQFPTLDMELTAWRRILYDYIFVRGDEERLNTAQGAETEQRILGLGERKGGVWTAL